MSAIWTNVSLVVGSLFGFMFVFVPGLGKLLSAHPMNEEMRYAFRITQKWSGIDGHFLRISIGMCYVIAGVGLLVGVWGEHLKMFKGDTLLIIQALLVCAPIGVISIHLFAMWYHFALEGKPGPAPVFIAFMGLLLYARLQVTPWTSLQDTQKLIIEVFAGVCVLKLVLATAFKVSKGCTPAELAIEKANVEADKELKTVDKQVTAGFNAVGQELQHLVGK
eukprot:TRINITY_DN64116_c0_g1_i1.p1 TRINITY_DN64116_c0_g1~~TRINITY_DN64116_c0_g1_i1.p1  ORF type:complete len:247 (+),score=26.83 TRINITY_DN64116_c0_g1_i1:81-743(+)